MKRGALFAPLLAAIALLCAQLAPAPAIRPDHLGPVAVAGHAEATVARITSTLTLVKTDRVSPTAKHGPPLDAVLPSAFGFLLLLGAAAMTVRRTRPCAAVHRPSPYRARGPPATRGRNTDIPIR